MLVVMSIINAIAAIVILLPYLIPFAGWFQLVSLPATEVILAFIEHTDTIVYLIFFSNMIKFYVETYTKYKVLTT